VHERRPSGFTLTELLIVVAILTIIATLAVPNLLSARELANESAVVATMRTLSSSQARVQAAAAIDVDRDGAGEYAYFGELSGEFTLRGSAGVLIPPALAAAFGQIGASRVVRSGYNLQIYLPGPTGAGVPEDPNGGKAVASAVDADLAETIWCIYAWPVSRGISGTRAFFVNQVGEILQTQNETGAYTGGLSVPAFDAAFLTPGTITGPIAIDTIGQDGERWTKVQ
jgi:prepilin-type N-terminal cleavage/methylation domain-containing protein